MAEGDFEVAKKLAAKLGIELPEAPNLTDLGNAKWLVLLHGDKLRYSWKLKCYLVWDETHWNQAKGDQMAGWLARDVAHKYYDMAAELNTHAASLNTQASTELDPGKSQLLATEAESANKKAGAFTGWAKRSESRERIRALIDLARHDPAINIEPEQLDQHPMLLNTHQGTIELETETLREHRPEDYLTQITAAHYEENPDFPLWTEAVESAVPDPEIREYLQKAFGRTLEGKSTADLIILAHGPGGTGKTTFMESLRRTLGNYAASTQIETFTARRDPGAVQPDLARLAGKRMVTVPEAETAGDVAKMLKVMTGGDSISTRSHHQETWEFTPNFILWLRANQRPLIPNDTGIWRRLREVPFEVKFSGDESIREKITNPKIAGPAILAWALEGHRKYRLEGMGDVPKGIAQATMDYQAEMDTVAAFLSECIVLVGNAWTPRPDLWKRYQEWTRGSGVPFSQRLRRNAFYHQVSEKIGADPITRNGVRGFKGIGLLSTRVHFSEDGEEETVLADTQGVLLDEKDALFSLSPYAINSTQNKTLNQDLPDTKSAPKGTFAPEDDDEGWIEAPRDENGDAVVPEGATTKMNFQTGEVKYRMETSSSADEDRREG